MLESTSAATFALHVASLLHALLADWYKNRGGSEVMEIVFVSCDKSAAEYEQYYSQMPWLALPYNSAHTEQLKTLMNVTSIPALVVLDAVTGRVVSFEGATEVGSLCDP